jgi:hypothetical protein
MLPHRPRIHFSYDGKGPAIWVSRPLSLTQRLPSITETQYTILPPSKGSTVYTPTATLNLLAFPHTFPSIGSTNAPHFLILLRTFLLRPLVSYAMVASRTTVASASHFVHSQSPDTL